MLPIALSVSITLSGILVFVAIFSFLILLIVKEKSLGDFKRNNFDLNVAFLLYILTFTFTKFFNTGPHESLNTFFRFCQDYFIYSIVYIFISQNYKNRKIIENILLISAIISISYGLLQFFNLDFFHRQGHIGKLSGFHKNPYTYAGQLIVFFFFILSQISSNKSDLMKMILLCLCFFCILNTSERAVLLGVFLSLVIYFIFKGMKDKKILIQSSVLLVPLISAFFLNKKLLNKVKNLILPQCIWRDNPRFKLWEVALNSWKKNIWIGTGKFLPVLHEKSPGMVHYLTHAHNVYLQVMVTNGIFGLIAFLSLIFLIFRKAFINLKTNKYSFSLILVLIAFLFEGFFEYFWGDSEVRYLL